MLCQTVVFMLPFALAIVREVRRPTTCTEERFRPVSGHIFPIGMASEGWRLVWAGVRRKLIGYHRYQDTAIEICAPPSLSAKTAPTFGRRARYSRSNLACSRASSSGSAPRTPITPRTGKHPR